MATHCVRPLLSLGENDFSSTLANSGWSCLSSSNDRPLPAKVIMQPRRFNVPTMADVRVPCPRPQSNAVTNTLLPRVRFTLLLS